MVLPAPPALAPYDNLPGLVGLVGPDRYDHLDGVVVNLARSRERLFLDGRWVPPAGTSSIEVVNPATEEVIGTVPDGTTADVDRAVAAARQAFDGWSRTPAEDRARVIEVMGGGLVARMEDLGGLMAEEVGSPLAMATVIQAGAPAMIMSSYPEIVRSFDFAEDLGNSTVFHQPVGVVAAITPWNYPLHQAVAKVAPALAAGCTVVLKPSEVAPLAALVLADVAEEASLPPGVLNVVTGGAGAGEALAVHPDVDMVSFTGSTARGRQVAAQAAPGIKRLTLELSGKSANVILDDADLEEAVNAGVRQCFMNAGQTCIAWTRMVVPVAQLAQAAELAGEVARSFVVGDPFDPATTMGPLATEAQRTRVRAAVNGGVDEGAKVVTGGGAPPAGLERGWFVEPTVLTDVDNSMAVAREEVFGPVLCLIAHQGDDDAVRIANDSPYGLHGAVYSRDHDRALAVARRLRTGQVGINGGGFDPVAPFGGFKQSGFGRELGRAGLREYLELTSIQG